MRARADAGQVNSQDALFGAVLVVNTVIGVAQELRANGRWTGWRS